MILQGFWPVFLVGCLGGALGDVLGIVEARKTGAPSYLRSFFYWVCLVLLALIGGGLTALYGVDNVKAVLAVNIGASAPLIIKSLASAAPRLQKPRIS